MSSKCFKKIPHSLYIMRFFILFLVFNEIKVSCSSDNDAKRYQLSSFPRKVVNILPGIDQSNWVFY